jgi:hypothetical protein
LTRSTANGDNVDMALRVGVLALVVAACGSDSRPPVDDTTPPPPSNNPIDVAIWPRLVATGLTDLPRASNDELCRRIALDLTGVTPTAEERATICAGNDVEAIARAFMATPRFREIERRFWIRRLGADPTAIMADHIKDADRLFEAAADGALAYDDLVAQLLAHPIMTINRSVAAGDDVRPTIDHTFRIFLGRAPSIAELAEYASLIRPWRRRHEDRYDLGYGYYTRMAALDPNACRDPVLGAAACTSTLFGMVTVVDPPLTSLAPTGYSQTSTGLYYYELVEGNVPAAIASELEKPGRLFATRDELWNEAADFALARWLGWWRSTANQPDSVLPEVQQALGTWFRALPRRDLRELYVTVMTSLLYTTSASVDGDERPPWATGPTKLLEPEQLLDSVGRALGRELGTCDPHTDEPIGRNFFWPQRLRETTATAGFDYRGVGQQLGGCFGAVTAPRTPGLPALLTHIGLARQLCANPSLPAEVTTMPQIGDYLFTQFLSRAPTPDERAALDAAATACSADPSCADADGFAREVCGALLRSTAFLYY